MSFLAPDLIEEISPYLEGLAQIPEAFHQHEIDKKTKNFFCLYKWSDMDYCIAYLYWKQVHLILEKKDKNQQTYFALCLKVCHF